MFLNKDSNVLQELDDIEDKKLVFIHRFLSILFSLLWFLMFSRSLVRCKVLNGTVVITKVFLCFVFLFFLY